jgi:hypothetical protein
MLGHALLRAELVDETADGHEQKCGGKEALEARATDEGDQRANRHDDEEARTVARNGSSGEQSDERENDGCIRDTLPSGNLPLGSKLERSMLRFVV